MNVEAAIRDRLAALDPQRLEIIDDSARHAGHAGAKSGGGHFSVHIVSDAFVGLSPIARHRRIHALLADLLPQFIHALSLSAHTPAEA